MRAGARGIAVPFDTPERTSFFAAARGRPRKFKVRTRLYAPDRMQRAMDHRPIRLSRGRTSLVAIDRALPDNRWGPALRHRWLSSSMQVAAVS